MYRHLSCWRWCKDVLCTWDSDSRTLWTLNCHCKYRHLNKAVFLFVLLFVCVSFKCNLIILGCSIAIHTIVSEPWVKIILSNYYFQEFKNNFQALQDYIMSSKCVFIVWKCGSESHSKVLLILSFISVLFISFFDTYLSMHNLRQIVCKKRNPL